MSQHSVTLDRIRVDDWRAVHSWASLAETCRFQAWGPNTEEQTRDFVRTAVEAWSAMPQQHFSYVARLGDEVIGMGVLHRRSRVQHQGEITYVVHPRLWGQGLGTDIARQLISLGFGQLELHRIYATCEPRNVGSSRVLKKIGMVYEGHHRHTVWIRDGWRDSLMFSILDVEWRSAAPHVNGPSQDL